MGRDKIIVSDVEIFSDSELLENHLVNSVMQLYTTIQHIYKKITEWMQDQWEAGRTCIFGSNQHKDDSVCEDI